MIKPNITPDEEREILEGLLDPSHDANRLYIELLDDCYRMHNVWYNNSMHKVDVTKRFLRDGAADTQGRWIINTKDSEWKIASTDLYFAVINTLHDNRDHPTQKELVEKARETIKSDLTNFQMITNSHVLYAGTSDLSTDQKRDCIIHDWGYPTKRKYDVTTIGPNLQINGSCKCDDSISALVGTNDMNKIGQACEWVTGKKLYLERATQRLDSYHGHDVILGRYNDKNIAIFANNDTLISHGISRGWRITKTK